MDAEREKVWNSPPMLRARAWLQEYCQTSAKITPEEGAKYQDELSKLSAVQMKLWLLKFDHELELQHQQDASWQMVHQAERAQSIAAINQTRQAYADYNQEESEAAEQANQQLATQSQDAQDMSELKSEEPTDPYSIGARGFYPYGGVQYHYHYHLYPNSN
jgi:vacuolar-type H+-ATPase subunit I/STV1